MSQPGRRELNKIQCRQRILKVSRQMFSQYGYDGAMMEEIAERACVSKATVYNYFPNKESLLLGSALEVRDRVVELLEENEEAGSLRRLYLAVETFVVSSLDYPGISRRIFYLNSFPDSPLYETREDILGIFRRLTEDAQADGTLRRDADTGIIVDLLLGVFLTAVFQWNGEQGEHLRRRLDQLLDSALVSFIAK